jgi:ATP-dependent Clp endopeptidase proteolytic subunit ClpP
MKSWYTIRARGSGAQGSRTEVLIYDEIGAYGVTAKGFLAELGALPDDATIDLRLNSPGGSVFDAVAIYNALRRHSGEVTVWIDGIAASAASYIAMAGDMIVMPENAFLMIHDPSGLVMGTAEDMRSTAEALDKVKVSLIQGYATKSGKPDEEIAALMAAETWLNATEALDLGLIDRIAEPVKLAASFDVARFRNAPPEVLEAAADAGPPSIGVEIQDEDPSPTAAPTGEMDTPVDRPEVPSSDTGDAPRDQGSANSEGRKVTAERPPSVKLTSEDLGPIDHGASSAPAIRAEAMAHARAVIDLCRLAGQPQMAGRFLEEDASLDAVRSRLLAAKADATPEITLSAHAQPGRAASLHPWGEVIARTFKTKG